MTQENIQEVDALRPVACIILSVVHILKVVELNQTGLCILISDLALFLLREILCHCQA